MNSKCKKVAFGRASGREKLNARGPGNIFHRFMNGYPSVSQDLQRNTSKFINSKLTLYWEEFQNCNFL